ncbi:MAG: transposase family protein [Haloplasmataceae bacterium]|nr:transposase family protein [Haloplasmataceae bacterium]
MTNYFFEIDFPNGEDDLRKKGVSKEHRVDPIVAMGLFMDSNGLPVNMSIFPGNTSDSFTLQPTMKDVKESYGLGRIVVVADKGLNKGGIIHLIDVGAAIAFLKVQNKKGEIVETLAYSDKDEIALDYKAIQDLFGTDCYNIYLRQEMFNKFQKDIALA